MTKKESATARRYDTITDLSAGGRLASITAAELPAETADAPELFGEALDSHRALEQRRRRRSGEASK